MPEKSQPKFFYGYIVVVASLIIISVMWGTFYSFGILLGPLQEDLGWTKETITGAYALASLISGFLGIATGGLSDKFGPKVILVVCGFLLGSGYLLMSNITAIWQLYLFYGGIIGVAMGGSVAPLTATIARWFIKNRGMMMGVAVTGFGVGIMIVPAIVNHLVYSYNWATACKIMGSAALVLIVAAALFLKRDPGQIGLLPYGYQESSKTGQSPKTSEFSYKEAIHFRQFWLLFVITLCYGIGMQAIMVHLVPYAMGINIPAEKAATIMATLGGISIASRIILGGAADRIGTRTTYSIAFILAAVALLWLVPSNTLWMLYLFAVIYGFAYGGESALRPLMVADLFGLKAHGIINGTIMLNLALGGAIGPLMAARISETYGSYIPAFQICAVLGIIAFILTFLIKPTTSNEDTPKGWLSKIWRR